MRCDAAPPEEWSRSLSSSRLPIRDHMTSSVVDAPEVVTLVETRTTCPACLMTLALDDERPKRGTVRWEFVSRFRLKMGTAVSFDCPNGHSSQHDPDLLKAFPSRRFYP